MGEPIERWLRPEDAALRVGKRVDQLRGLVKRGLLPQPSYHFGPNSPRYDRVALDALFTTQPTGRSLEQAEEDAVNAIIKRAGQGRKKAFGRRDDQGISIRRQG